MSALASVSHNHDKHIVTSVKDTEGIVVVWAGMAVSEMGSIIFTNDVIMKGSSNLSPVLNPIEHVFHFLKRRLMSETQKQLQFGNVSVVA